MSKKFTKLLSPVGTARYSYLHVPSDKFAPIFKTDLIVLADECVEFCKWLDARNEEAWAEACKENPKFKKAITKHECYSAEVDDDGNETGTIIFKFKCSTTFQKKDGTIAERKIKAFDSKAKPIEMPAVYSGSTIRVEFTPVNYFNPSAKESGISLRILSVQILDLVTFDTDGKSRGYQEEGKYDYIGEAIAAKPVVATPSADTSTEDDVNSDSFYREQLAEAVTAISQGEGVEEAEVLRSLTRDPNGLGGVADVSAIPYKTIRLDGTPAFPLITAVTKAKKRLALADDEPFQKDEPLQKDAVA